MRVLDSYRKDSQLILVIVVREIPWMTGVLPPYEL